MTIDKRFSWFRVLAASTAADTAEDTVRDTAEDTGRVEHGKPFSPGVFTRG